MDLFDKMKKYSVPADSLEEFLIRYTRTGRGEERGADYQAARIEFASERVEKYGYCMISRHDSKTGDIVTWFPPRKQTPRPA